MAAWRYEFYFLALKTILYRSKIKFISLHRHVISSMYLPLIHMHASTISSFNLCSCSLILHRPSYSCVSIKVFRQLFFNCTVFTKLCIKDTCRMAACLYAILKQQPKLLSDLRIGNRWNIWAKSRFRMLKKQKCKK